MRPLRICTVQEAWQQGGALRRGAIGTLMRPLQKSLANHPVHCTGGTAKVLRQTLRQSAFQSRQAGVG